jgi:hypothetical protein
MPTTAGDRKPDNEPAVFDIPINKPAYLGDRSIRFGETPGLPIPKVPIPNVSNTSETTGLVS